MEIGQRGIKLFNDRTRVIYIYGVSLVSRCPRLSYGIAVHVIQKWLKLRRAARTRDKNARPLSYDNTTTSQITPDEQ